MAPTVMSIEKDEPSGNQAKGPIRRRNRIPVSCESCRSRKLKCDRQKPCQNCRAREMQAGCTYATNGTTKGKGSINGGPDDVGDRIHRLEALVTSLVKGAPPSNPTSDHPYATADSKTTGYPALESALQGSTPYGAMAAASEGDHFVGESHWEAVLRDITALKEHFEGEPKAQPKKGVPLDANQPALLGGVTRSIDRQELIDSLPPKHLADRLVLRFWETYDPSIPLNVHKPTFMKNYENSWTSIDNLSLPKLGLYFSVFCLALQSYMRDGGEPLDLQGYSEEWAGLYRQRAAQCILAADITAPSQDSVQCFMLYGVSEYSRLPNGDASLWMIHGILVRKAMLMGYHRDPDSFPGMTPFEGEMRRRIWHSICQLDLLFSFQLGLPSMIQYNQTDVAPPRSLFEEELYEDMPRLPPSRPPSEPTPIWYLIGKQRIFRVFADVVLHLNSIKVPSDSQVFELNQRLADVYESLPDHLKTQPWERSYMDSTALKIQRMHLQTFYDKVICVLNRRFIAMPRAHPQFAHSRALCIRSALSLLSIQIQMQQAGMKWYVYSFTRNDFLLATVIVCLVIYTRKKVVKQGNQPYPDYEVEQENVQLAQALENARNIWMEISDRSPDARRACKIIDSMQQKVQAPEIVPYMPVTEQSSIRGQNNKQALTPESLQDVQACMLDWAPWDSVIHGTNFDAYDHLDDLWTMGSM